MGKKKSDIFGNELCDLCQKNIKIDEGQSCVVAAEGSYRFHLECTSFRNGAIDIPNEIFTRGPIENFKHIKY